MTPAINTLNMAQRDRAIAALSPLVENAPWVAEAAVDARPYTSDETIAEALVAVILNASQPRRLGLFNEHPELAATHAPQGRMTAESKSEQGRLGLNDLPPHETQKLNSMNAAYRVKFGHPFIIALHRVPDRATLFQIFEQRLGASPLEEHTTTLAEITSVIRSRCRAAFGSTADNTTTVPSLKQFEKSGEP